MAITELVFPKFKTDEESVKVLEREAPAIRKNSFKSTPGFVNAFSGAIIHEDGTDLQINKKPIEILEWVNEAAFHTFVSSEKFVAMQVSIKTLVSGPPVIQVFETTLSPDMVVTMALVEVFRVSVPNIDAVQETWKNIAGILADSYEGKGVLSHGKSLNLVDEVLIGIIGWASADDRAAILKDPKLIQELESLQLLGKLSQMMIQASPVEL